MLLLGGAQLSLGVPAHGEPDEEVRREVQSGSAHDVLRMILRARSSNTASLFATVRREMPSIRAAST